MRRWIVPGNNDDFDAIGAFNKLQVVDWRQRLNDVEVGDPFCEECYENGVMTPAEQVHHIVPLSEGGSNDFENLKSLCKSCHSKIHAERGDRWGKEQAAVKDSL